MNVSVSNDWLSIATTVRKSHTKAYCFIVLFSQSLCFANPLMEEKLTARLSLKVSAELRQALTREARRRQRSVNWLARHFLQESLKSVPKGDNHRNK